MQVVFTAATSMPGSDIEARIELEDLVNMEFWNALPEEAQDELIQSYFNDWLKGVTYNDWYFEEESNGNSN